jgi:hypothetical protein
VTRRLAYLLTHPNTVDFSIKKIELRDIYEIKRSGIWFGGGSLPLQKPFLV